MTSGSPVTVRDAPDAHAFEAVIDGVVVGRADYLRTDDLVVFKHTEVDPAYEGRGVGAALARAALDDARARGVTVIPTCPFFAAYIARHPEYASLVYDSRSQVAD